MVNQAGLHLLLLLTGPSELRRKLHLGMCTTRLSISSKAGALPKAHRTAFENTEHSEGVAWVQGIIQLSIIFMQIAPITISFAVVNIVEAGIRYSPCQDI